MSFIHFNASRCDLCGKCISSCPFNALSMAEHGVVVNENCRMCSLCVKSCPNKAIYFEQKAGAVDKNEWKDFLIYVEQENGSIHPVAFELIGEARKMAAKIGYKVNCLIIGGKGTAQNAQELLDVGVDEVFVYEHEGFEGFKADCYADAAADCISRVKPSSVLIGATSLGRSLAPRLSTRFHTGLTADCTALDIMPNSDMVQIRPAFGGNIMAQILIDDARPQFATVRYRIMDRAEKVSKPAGKVTICNATEDMTRSRIRVVSRTLIEKKKAIEDEDIIVAIGRGVKNEEGIAMCEELANLLGGTVAYSRPMVEKGIGTVARQIGLSGHTVKPRLIITCGISGAIQFTSCMKGAETIVAINTDPNAQIFSVATYCINDDLYSVLPRLIQNLKSRKEGM